MLFAALAQVVPDATMEILDGLDHFAPDEKAPAVIAARVRATPGLPPDCPPQRRERLQALGS